MVQVNRKRKKEWDSDIPLKELLIPMYSTHPSEEMALIQGTQLQ